MLTPKAGSVRFLKSFGTWLGTALVLLSILVACSGVAQSAPPVATPTVQVGLTPFGPRPILPVPTNQANVPADGIQGPANFLLSTPFQFTSLNGTTTDDAGTPTPIASDTLEAGVRSEFKHLLFVIDNKNNVNVYSPGSTTPTKASVARRTDGGFEISYTQMANSELGVAAISFDGVLNKNQITVGYQQQYSPALTSGGTESNIAVIFQAQVQWVPAVQIPTAPQNGQFTFTSDRKIALSWTAGQHASSYDVYRLIPNEDQQFQLIATVHGTAYTDASADAWQNAHSSVGINYGIFAVGPTGVENPSGIPINPATS